MKFPNKINQILRELYQELRPDFAGEGKSPDKEGLRVAIMRAFAEEDPFNFDLFKEASAHDKLGAKLTSWEKGREAEYVATNGQPAEGEEEMQGRLFWMVPLAGTRRRELVHASEVPIAAGEEACRQDRAAAMADLAMVQWREERLKSARERGAKDEETLGMYFTIEELAA